MCFETRGYFLQREDFEFITHGLTNNKGVRICACVCFFYSGGAGFDRFNPCQDYKRDAKHSRSAQHFRLLTSFPPRLLLSTIITTPLAPFLRVACGARGMPQVPRALQKQRGRGTQIALLSEVHVHDSRA